MNTREQWQLTMEAAELYERYPARYILGPWAPLLVEAARLTAGERVLDIACGTGVVTRAAAKRVGPTGRIVGIDLNPGMIAVARSLPAPIGASIFCGQRNRRPLYIFAASSQRRGTAASRNGSDLFSYRSAYHSDQCPPAPSG